MNPILEELFYGQIRPFERIVPQDPGYHPLNQQISGIKETLQTKLPADDYQALEELLNLCCDSGVLETCASFGYGFKLGALMMMEVLGGRELETRARAEWDLVPQMQVTLSTRQHIMLSVGVRVPMNNAGPRPTQLMFYLLWDWFDGGLRDGW